MRAIRGITKTEVFFLFFLIVSCCVIYFWFFSLSADDVERNTTLQDYEKSNFPKENSKLEKINSDSVYGINVGCLAENCDENFKQLQRFLTPKRFEIHLTNSYDPAAKINIIYLANKITPANNDFYYKNNFHLNEGERVLVDASKDCASFAIVTDLERRSIVVATPNTGSWKRDVSCSLFQLMMSSGMRITNEFDDLWDPKGGGLKDYSVVSFDRYLQIFGRFLALHFMSQTKSGMNEADFKNTISKQSLKDIFGE